LAHSRRLFQGPPENPFGHAVAINIGQVEQRVTGFVSSKDGAAAFRFHVRRDLGSDPGPGDSPAAIGQPAALQWTSAERDVFHNDGEG